MKLSSAPVSPCLERAASRRLGFVALFLVLVAATACGTRSASSVSQATQVPTSTPIAAATATEITWNGAIDWNGAIGCVAPSRPSSAGGCVVQDAASGISLRVSQAYANVTNTVLQLDLSEPGAFQVQCIGINENPKTRRPFGQLLHGIDGYYGGPSALLAYEPLPTEDFGRPARLLTTVHIGPWLCPSVLGGATPYPSPSSAVDLTLNVPFAIIPVGSGHHVYHQAPVIKQGIGVQVQSLDFSPPHSLFYWGEYGRASGARIKLLFSGLPANLELLSFLKLESRSFYTEHRAPGLLRLQVPGMTVSTPAMTLLQNPEFPTDGQVRQVDPTVGPAGTVQLEVSYQGHGVPTGQPATLFISGIQLLTGGIDGTTGAVPVLPSRQITLPLR